jgi:hypothetical protein
MPFEDLRAFVQGGPWSSAPVEDPEQEGHDGWMSSNRNPVFPVLPFPKPNIRLLCPRIKRPINNLHDLGTRKPLQMPIRNMLEQRIPPLPRCNQSVVIALRLALLRTLQNAEMTSKSWLRRMSRVSLVSLPDV